MCRASTGPSAPPTATTIRRLRSITASDPLLQFANSNNLGFIPLHGERDEEEAIRRQHSVARLGSRRRHVSHQCVEFFRSQQHRRIQSLFSAHHSERRSSAAGSSRCARPASPTAPSSTSPIPTRLPWAGGFINGGLTDFSFSRLGSARSRPAQHAQRRRRS